LVAAGKVGRALTIEEGAEAAKVAALNALAQVAAAAGGLDKIEQIVRVGVFVNSSDGFTDQPKVANGASDLLAAILGDAGRHARAAVGANELPLNAPVEIEVIARIRT
jgi:enamine deaminase RidA (YjgF/YER057c/UK114 family)